MTEDGYEALRAALALARNHQVRTVAELRRTLIYKGYKPGPVAEALQFWGNREVQLAAKRV
jgi:hypothetical protein